MSLELTREIGVTVREVLVTGDPVLNLRGRSDADAKLFMRSHGIDPNGSYVCLGLRSWHGFAEKAARYAQLCNTATTDTGSRRCSCR